MWLARWQSAFAIGAYQYTGNWGIDGGIHHLFDTPYMTRVLRGGSAELAYDAAPASALVILFQGRDRLTPPGEYRDTEVEPKPSIGELKTLAITTADFLVFPLNLEWSAFFFHDDRLATAFSRREWVSDLD
jgi:hypothetical protein